MRCNNCGWENPQGNARCEKCNAPLSNSDSGRDSFNSSNSENQREDNQKANLKGTLSEGQVFGSQMRHEIVTPNHEKANSGNHNLSCPECGYPMARNVSICPNCGNDNSGKKSVSAPSNSQSMSMNQKPRIKCSKCGIPMEANAKFCQSCGAPVRQGTVNPWMTPQSGAFCTLKPLPWQNEDIEYNPLSYSGETIILNRSNTDPNNQSITSKEQAYLVYENGSWFIEDKSTQQTTYVHAGRKTKLETGDIIILGNRRFEFKG